VIIICCNLNNNSLFSQKNSVLYEKVRRYKLYELDTANVDSVSAINLSKTKLTEIPTILYRFDKIEYLDLSKNKLKNVDSLHVFANLQYLDLGKNKLETFPISICRLSELRWLSLQSNNISIIPPCIQYCQRLEYVDLWGSMISSMPEEMALIHTLKEIDLSAIQFNQYQQEQLRELFPNVRLKMGQACNCGF